jgi:hypothetical protein
LLALASAAVAREFSRNGSPTNNNSSGLGQKLGPSIAPLGSDPFGSFGKDVSLGNAAMAFSSAAPAGTGAILQSNASAANSSNLTHVWVGPAPVSESKSGTAVILEYASGIRIRMAPLTMGVDSSEAAVRASYVSDAAEWGSNLASVQTIDGVPAEVLHGDGSTIPIPHGDEIVNGTDVNMIINGVSILIWADPTVPEADVLATAESLTPVNTPG